MQAGVFLVNIEVDMVETMPEETKAVETKGVETKGLEPSLSTKPLASSPRLRRQKIEIVFLASGPISKRSSKKGK